MRLGVFYAGHHLFFKGNRRGISRRQQAIGFLLTVNEGGERVTPPQAINNDQFPIS